MLRFILKTNLVCFNFQRLKIISNIDCFGSVIHKVIINPSKLSIGYAGLLTKSYHYSIIVVSYSTYVLTDEHICRLFWNALAVSTQDVVLRKRSCEGIM